VGTFKVVQIAEGHTPAEAIEWTGPGRAPILIPRRFRDAASAQDWADRLAQIGGNR